MIVVFVEWWKRKTLLIQQTDEQLGWSFIGMLQHVYTSVSVICVVVSVGCCGHRTSDV